MLRVGLVGVGDAGRHHGRALAALAAEGVLRWSAVCARRPEALRAFREHVSMPPDVAAFPALDELLAAEACDAIILATPDGLHAEQAARVAGARRHVLVEKPLALTASDAAGAVDCARRSGVHLAVGYHLRHHPAHRLAVERRQELVGPLRSVFVRWAWPDPAKEGWRARGDGARFWSLAALGTHGVDLALWITGATSIDEVVALLDGHPDHAAEVTLRLGGVLAHISVSVRHRAVSRLLVTGESGEVEAVGTLGARGEGQLLHRAPGEPPRPLAFEAADPYVAQLRAFVAGAGGGFVDDPCFVANIEALDRAGDRP